MLDIDIIVAAMARTIVATKVGECRETGATLVWIWWM